VPNGKLESVIRKKGKFSSPDGYIVFNYYCLNPLVITDFTANKHLPLMTGTNFARYGCLKIDFSENMF
jgi:hypothetical protein